MILGFHHKVHKKRTVLGYYAAYSGNCGILRSVQW